MKRKEEVSTSHPMMNDSWVNASLSLKYLKLTGKVGILYSLFNF